MITQMMYTSRETPSSYMTCVFIKRTVKKKGRRQRWQKNEVKTQWESEGRGCRQLPVSAESEED